MMRKTFALIMLVALLVGLLKGASNGYLSVFDASPKDLKLSVRSENSTVIVKWELRGGSIVRALAGKRDAVIFVYPDWVEDGDKWSVLGDARNLCPCL
ncbi:hypothetical protein [Thermococcus sp.]